MGMYTKINVILKIKQNTPKEIKNILIDIFDGCDVIELRGKTSPRLLEHHKFFDDGSSIWFPASEGSYYFTGTSNSCIKYADITKQMVLHIDSDFKDYNNEIHNFFDWITPYVDANENEFLGYSRYEETNNPTLYFFKNNKIQSFINYNVEEY